jgi:hypothetical protein
MKPLCWKCKKPVRLFYLEHDMLEYPWVAECHSETRRGIATNELVNAVSSQWDVGGMKPSDIIMFSDQGEKPTGIFEFFEYRSRKLLGEV